MSDIETLNKFLVAMRGDLVVIMNPPRTPISRDDALVLAAYLVALADDHDRFAEVLGAVCSA